jgi:hypothetical protein
MNSFARASARVALVTLLLMSALTGVTTVGFLFPALAFALTFEAACWIFGSLLGLTFHKLNIRETPIAKGIAFISLPVLTALLIPALAAACPLLVVPSVTANMLFTLAFLAISALTMYRGKSAS